MSVHANETSQLFYFSSQLCPARFDYRFIQLIHFRESGVDVFKKLREIVIKTRDEIATGLSLGKNLIAPVHLIPRAARD